MLYILLQNYSEREWVEHWNFWIWNVDRKIEIVYFCIVSLVSCFFESLALTRALSQIQYNGHIILQNGMQNELYFAFGFKYIEGYGCWITHMKEFQRKIVK